MSTISKNRNYIRKITFTAMFAALIAVCSWVSIPMTIPFTLQTMAVCIASGMMGPAVGIASVVVYIALGAVGVPVFAGFSGGVGVLFGNTGGYILGFVFTAAIVGFATKLFGKKWYVLAASMIIGIAVCYFFGTVWFITLYTKNNGAISVGTALGWCVTPYILPDLAKVAIATAVVNRVNHYVKF